QGMTGPMGGASVSIVTGEGRVLTLGPTGAIQASQVMRTDASNSGMFTGSTGSNNVRIETFLGVGIDPYTQEVIPGFKPIDISDIYVSDSHGIDFDIQGRYLY